MGLFSLSKLKAINPLSSGTPPMAIDLGAQSIKVLQLSPLNASDGHTTQVAAMLAVPEAVAADPSKRLAWQLEELPRMIKGLPLRGKRAVISIPCAQLFCKHLQLPLGDGAPPGPIVEAAVAVQLRTDPGALLVRYFIVPGTGSPGKSEVIALAASRSIVKRIMDALKQCRLEPVGIHPEPIALLHSFDHLSRRAEDAETSSLFLDLGAGHTKVVIAHGQTMVFAKTIQVGGRYMDQLLSKAKNCTMGEARNIRAGLLGTSRPTPQAVAQAPRDEGRAIITPPPESAAAPTRTGIPALDAVLQREAGAAAAADDRRNGQSPAGVASVSPPNQYTGSIAMPLALSESLDSLTDEIASCLRYYEMLFPGRRVQRSVFVGGESRYTGLCQHIARRLKIPAHAADPLARFPRSNTTALTGVDLSQPQPGWSVAVGLAVAKTDL